MNKITPFPNLTPEFLQRTKDVAEKIQTAPENLLAVMYFETGGTFSAAQKNHSGGSAVGLIQFMPRTAKGLGTSSEELSKMTNVKQLDYVEKYLSSFKGKVGDIKNLYLSIIYPKALKSQSEEVFSKKSTLQQYVANKGFDLNKDGQITKSEMSERVGKTLEFIQKLNLFRFV